jgi:hypothetical protein
MAHQARKCWPYVLGMASIVLAALGVAAQQPPTAAPPQPAPLPSAPPVPPLTIVADGAKEAQLAKPLTKQEVNNLIETTFGKDSAETRRPVRLWLSDIGMAIAAKEAIIGKDARIRFVDVSLGLPAEAKVLHGSEATVIVDQPITDIESLGSRSVMTVELRGKNGTVSFTPQGANGEAALNEVRFRTITKTVQVAEQVPVNFTVAANVPAFFPPSKRVVGIRFNFKLDPKTPLADLMPPPARYLTKAPIPFNEDLTKVPEIAFGESIAKESPKHDAMESIAHATAKINHLNLKKTDGFMLAMLDKRSDLRGMPFLMGEECRTREDQAKIFAEVANAVNQAFRGAKEGNLPDGMMALAASLSERKLGGQANPEMINRALSGALMQILMPESAANRVGLARCLATIPHIDATKNLARLAIFSAEDEVRAAAIEGLRLRRERDYTNVLLQGMAYPLPVVAKRAAEALVKLDRKDLLADLVDILERPDPRLPVTEQKGGKEVTTVRELVKVNHHRNCLLCHAPGNTENTPEGVLKVAVPLPTEPLPRPSDGGGYQSLPSVPDILVRIDMTYLRQDFSLLMPVADAHPWPDMQRFDFLVRTRTVTPAEAQAYEARREVEEPGRPSAYHRAALFALRELSGRDAEPTPQAWRKVLNLAKRS